MKGGVTMAWIYRDKVYFDEDECFEVWMDYDGSKIPALELYQEFELDGADIIEEYMRLDSEDFASWIQQALKSQLDDIYRKFFKWDWAVEEVTDEEFEQNEEL